MKSLKFIISMLLVVMFVFNLNITKAEASGDISIFVNGMKQSYSQPPIIENGRTLVPLRGIFEALGASVQWNSETKTIDAAKGNTSVWLKIGSTSTKVNGETIIISTPAQVKNGRTLVPLRFISESLGDSVAWDNESKTVYIGGSEKNSRTSPAEIGKLLTVEKNDWLDGHQKYAIELTQTISGDEAWEIIKNANMYNSPPDAGMKYVLAKFRIKILELEIEPYNINHAKFNAVSKSGVKYDNWLSLAGLKPDLRTDLYEGAEHEGWTYFMVNDNDEPLAVLNQGWDDEVWFDISN